MVHVSFFLTGAANNTRALAQIRFLRSVQQVFLTKRTLVEADLYDPPLTNFGRNAVERFFTPPQIGDLLQLTQSLAA
jgi:type I restriction enzyme R subunit